MIRIKTTLFSKLKSILPLLLCSLCTPVIAGYEATSVIQPFSAGGNFVFQTVAPVSDPDKTCTLQPESTFSLIMYACQTNSLDCTDDNNYVQININQNPSIDLVGNASYHFSPQNIKNLSDRYFNRSGGYPTRIQIQQLYCSGAGAATRSNEGMYTASCSSSGCTATSGPIIVTFPG